MKTAFTVIALTLTTLVGYSQTDFKALMDFNIWGNEITFNLPENDENYDVLPSNIGLTGSNPLQGRITQVKLTSAQGYATLDCGDCIFNTTSSISERTITVSGDNLLFNIVVELSGYLTINNQVFPASTSIPWGVPLTSYVFQTDGLDITTSVGDIDAVTFNVGQNYPNPFTNATTVEFSSPKIGTIDFSVFDVTGKLVENRKVDAERGVNTIEYGDRLSSGVYFYQMEVDDQRITRRFVKSGG